MSTCISRYGEYSDHIADDQYTCTRCGALDEDGLIDELTKIRARLAQAEQDRDDARYGRQETDNTLDYFIAQRDAAEAEVAYLRVHLFAYKDVVAAAKEEAELIRLVAAIVPGSMNRSRAELLAAVDALPTLDALPSPNVEGQ